MMSSVVHYVMPVLVSCHTVDSLQHKNCVPVFASSLLHLF